MKIILPHWLELVLGVKMLDDAIVDECIVRAKKRCANVDVFLHSRHSAEDALAVAAREAVAAVFQDHFPQARRANVVRQSWPRARVMLLGNRATIQIWIGHDYDDVDGIEPFDIVVDRPATSLSMAERVKLRFGKARRTAPLVLTEPAPAALVAASTPPPVSPPAQTIQRRRAAPEVVPFVRSSRMSEMVAAATTAKTRRTK